MLLAILDRLEFCCCANVDCFAAVVVTTLLISWSLSLEVRVIFLPLVLGHISRHQLKEQRTLAGHSAEIQALHYDGLPPFESVGFVFPLALLGFSSMYA